ncbi:oxidoreductase [Pyricularia oryzae Y34]|uniref:Oxidoreductase n=1 Tax=Pyricularia oryzae (strain Y34) TaxID=1143189 RepID=A0AA97PN60_PYRO3|nr:oxidoreductase [Pyricularia oryzae Y34]
MLSLPQLVALCVAAMFAYDPVARLLGFGGQQQTMSSSQHGSPRSRHHHRPNLTEALHALEDVVNGTRVGVEGLRCEPDSLAVHVFSRQPLVFEPIYTPSTVTDDAGPRRDKSIRDSEVALVPRTDTVRCIEARARSLQGWRDETWIERLRVQRYHVGGHYGHHFDWMEPRMGYARVSSIMAWVGDGDGSLVGGGTEFPLLQRPSSDDRWCKFVIGCGGSDDAEKDQRRQGGVVFKPIVGNAVFWENFNPQAGPGGVVRGYEESWHAGLPVERGVKVGLNVWSYGRVD